MSADYDEGAINARLTVLGHVHRVLFACACAERLFPLYELFASKTGHGEAEQLRNALDVAWAVQTSGAPGDEIDGLRAGVEELVPHDDEAGWSAWSPFAQNAASAVAYALRAWLSGESQNSVWAARQLYEAADYLLQLGEPGDAYVDEGEPVSLALRSIADALAGVEATGITELGGIHLAGPDGR